MTTVDKYLDERITISVTLAAIPSLRPKKGIQRYIIREQNPNNTSTGETIFSGNFYYERTSITQTFDITDIVRSRKKVFDASYLTNSTTYSGISGNLINRYDIIVYATTNSGEAVRTSDWVSVAMIYRYPNFNSLLGDGSEVFFETSGYTESVFPALQGFGGNNTHFVIPLVSHYPQIETSNYKFAQSFVNSDDISAFQISIENSQPITNYNVSATKNSTSCFIKLSDIVDWETYATELQEPVSIYKSYDGDFYTKIAEMDICPKRYYLQWQDRFGGYQSQGFNDFARYSETFDVTETKNYKDERKKSAIQVQPKWKISSGWLKEDLYPIYESIYVSPVLILYDTYEDKSYEVIVRGDYTEKTYKSEKKLLNITLELEAISKQNILY